jgi:hypothetical protein
MLWAWTKEEAAKPSDRFERPRRRIDILLIQLFHAFVVSAGRPWSGRVSSFLQCLGYFRQVGFRKNTVSANARWLRQEAALYSSAHLPRRYAALPRHLANR